MARLADAGRVGGCGRRVARSDMPDLPRVPMEDRTIGRTFGPGDGREYRPSMFVTLTLPSYGKVRHGVPVDPDTYDYRRAALDAVLFARLVDRFWDTLRKVAGFKVQYFAAVEVQLRMAAHLHAAIRGAIPRRIIKDTVAAVYYSAWWPPIDQVLYDDQVPRWDGSDYVDPDHGCGAADLGGGVGPGPGRPGRGADARGPVRHADRHRRDHRPVTRMRTGPSGT